ncbi:MAG: hypothetical protein AB7U18_27325 [Dehalococcoidia bacterium]
MCWILLCLLAVGYATPAGMLGLCLYLAVVLLGASLGLDRGHSAPALPGDAYVASPLELSAILVAGAPTGWLAQRLWRLGLSWRESGPPAARALDRSRPEPRPDLPDRALRLGPASPPGSSVPERPPSMSVEVRTGGMRATRRRPTRRLAYWPGAFCCSSPPAGFCITSAWCCVAGNSAPPAPVASMF